MLKRRERCHYFFWREKASPEIPRIWGSLNTNQVDEQLGRKGYELDYIDLILLVFAGHKVACWFPVIFSLIISIITPFFPGESFFFPPPSSYTHT